MGYPNYDCCGGGCQGHVDVACVAPTWTCEWCNEPESTDQPHHWCGADDPPWLTVTPKEAAAWIPLAPVIVTWLDHTSRTGWNAGNLVAPARVTEVGYVYKETEEFLILVHGYDLDDHDTLSASAIPLGCIEKVVTLRVA